MPAFASTTSIPPSRSTVPSTAAWTEAWSVTSHANQACPRPELGGERLQPLGLQAREREARAAGRGDARGLRADAARGAGDEDDLAGEWGSACHGASQPHAAVRGRRTLRRPRTRLSAA